MHGGRLVGNLIVSSVVATGLVVTAPLPGANATNSPSARRLPQDPAPTPIDAPRNATIPVAIPEDAWREPSGLRVTFGEAAEAARRTGRRWEATWSRTETTKLFVNPDGTRTLVAASGRLHVRKADGWVDVDTRLQVADGVVRPAATAPDVAFSAGGSAPLVRLREGSSDVEIRWPDALPAPELGGDTARYRDVSPGVDVVVRATPDGFEHSVVLTRRPATAPVVRLPLSLAGASVTTNPQGSLVLVGADGERLAQAGAPLMYDAPGRSGDHDVPPPRTAPLPTKVEHGPHGPELVLRADAAFLNDPATTYPVTLDPTWRRGRDSDVWVQQGNTTWQGASPELRLGNFSGSVARFYVTFELASIANKTVQSATMKLYNYSSSCIARGVNVYQVLSGWDPQTITWSGPNQPQIATTPVTTRTFANSIYDATCPPPAPDGYQGFSVTSLASGWAAGTTPNYGVQLRASSETDTTAWKRFWSGDSSDPLRHPLMEVTYTDRDDVVPPGNGFEPWWSYVTRNPGPESVAAVNVANGNLVVQTTDSTPIQARGGLAFVLRRTYNSDAYDNVTLPGGIGAGWLLNVGEVVGADSAEILGAALEVPNDGAFGLTSTSVTLVDRDGTRHVFRRKSDVQLPVTSALNPVLQPLSTVIPAGYASLCLDAPYQAPRGVRLSLWRYVAVHGSCGQYDPNSLVTGFVTMRPDRVRAEFDQGGRLVNLRDGSGSELRYSYNANGRLASVSEPASCVTRDGASVCRTMTFTYADASVKVTDPAGRTTEYVLRTSGGRTLLDKVVNPILAGANTGEWIYRYQGDSGIACGAPAGKLCDVVDPETSIAIANAQEPRGWARTSVTYASNNVVDINDRRQVGWFNTHLTYGVTHTVVDQSGHQQVYRFHEGDPAQVDGSGRVFELAEGYTPSGGGVAAAFERVTKTLWDRVTPARSCRIDGAVDNNVCETVVLGGSGTTGTVATPDGRTQMTYDDLGNVLRVREIHTNPAGFGTASPATLDTTFSYRNQYRTPTGTSVAEGNLTGGGQVSAGTATPAITDRGQVLYTISDLVQSLPPRGNTTADPARVAALRTNYRVLANTAAAPSTRPTTTQSCSESDHGGSNSGLVCRVDAPAHEGSGRSLTTFEFNTFGERTQMRTPKSWAEPQPVGPQKTYTYRYYEQEFDLVGGTPASGWLKAVADPEGQFVVFAYDRAGNVVRTWDRDATARTVEADGSRTPVESYPGATTAPTSPDYAEVRYSANAPDFAMLPDGTEDDVAEDFLHPWRYPRSLRDQVGNTTAVDVDANGNPRRITPPRGFETIRTTFPRPSTTAYDITAEYDAEGLMTWSRTPLAGRTDHTYDAFGNRRSTRDPNGGYAVTRFDSVNRAIRVEATRSGYATTAPTRCRYAASSDSPVPAGYVLCGHLVTYDGHDHVKTASDNVGTGATSSDELHTAVYDSVGRVVERRDPRLALVNGTPELRTQLRYDADGRVTDSCTPRLVSEGDGVCDADSPFSTHVMYDDAGTPSSSTTYRETGQPLTTRFRYDAAGNVRDVVDARASTESDARYTVTSTYDHLDRLVARVAQRGAASPGNVSDTTTRWEYAPSGDLLFEIRGAGTAERHVTGHSYDSAHRPVDTVAGLVAGDSFGDRVAAMTSGTSDIDGGSDIRTRHEYDADGNVHAVFAPRAFRGVGSVDRPSARHMTRYDYDRDGRLVATRVPRYTPEGADVSDASDAASPDQAAQCPQIANYGNPATSRPATVGVCSTTFAYNPAGNVAQVYLPTSPAKEDGKYIAYGLSLDGLVTSVMSPSPKTPGQYETTTIGYDNAGRQTSVTAPLSRSSRTTYTLDGLLRRSFDAKDREWLREYDHNGNVTSDTNPLLEATTYTYSADDLLREVATPGDAAGTADRTTYTYDGIGNTLTIKAPTANGTEDDNNPSGAEVVNAYTYDSLLASTSRPYRHSGSVLTSRRKTSFTYDAVGRKTTQTTGETGATPTSAFTSGTTTQQFTYYPNSRLKMETGRSGATISRSYDADGNLSTIYSAPGAAPAILPACPAEGTICSRYYLDGLLRDTVDPAGRSTSYGYAGDGARTSFVVAGGAAPTKTATSHNFAGVPATTRAVVDGTTREWTYAYDEAGRATSRAEPNGTRSEWTYDTDDALLTASLTAVQPGPATALASWSYTYDALGRQDRATYTGYDASNDGMTPGTPSASETYDFDYHPSGRLKRLTANTTAHDYVWDRNGNLESGFTGGARNEFEYNADDSIAQVTSPGVATAAYAYDTSGNTRRDDKLCYDYDGFDRLVSAAPHSGTGCGDPIVTYGYDGVDRQTSRTVGNATTSLHYAGLGTAVVEEAEAAATRAYVRDAAGEVRAVRTGASASPIEYLHTDGHGNVTAVTGSAPSSAAPGLALLCTARYDAHGSPMTPRSDTNPCRTGSTASDHFYRGERRDAATGAYQLGARTYAPARAGFLTPDTYRSASSGADLALSSDPLTANRYGYVNGDPVNYADPTGHERLCVHCWARDRGKDIVNGAKRVYETARDALGAVVDGARNGATYIAETVQEVVQDPAAAFATVRDRVSSMADSAWQMGGRAANGFRQGAATIGNAIGDAASYCFGRGARTCAAVAGTIAIVATGVGVGAGLGLLGSTALGYAGTLGTFATAASFASSAFSFFSYAHTGDKGDLYRGIAGLALPAAWKGFRMLRGLRAAKVGTGTRVFTSSDEHVADAANALERAMPGSVKGVNVNVRQLDGRYREVDIDLGKLVVQVKSGNARGLTGQLARTRETTGLNVLGYAPGIPGQAVYAASRSGLPIARSLDELVAMAKGLL